MIHIENGSPQALLKTNAATSRGWQDKISPSQLNILPTSTCRGVAVSAMPMPGTSHLLVHQTL